MEPIAEGERWESLVCQTVSGMTGPRSKNLLIEVYEGYRLHVSACTLAVESSGLSGGPTGEIGI